MSLARPVIALSGTWTLDPLAPVVGYWFDLLHVDADVRLAPYAQVFQQLLDPDSTLRRNHAGANVVCLRWEDLLPHGNATGADTPALLAARIDELHAAITVLPHHVPCLVVVGPGDAANRVFNEATRALSARLAGIPEVHVQDGADAMARYRVGRVQTRPPTASAMSPIRRRTGRAGHRHRARGCGTRAPPIKLFAVDATTRCGRAWWASRASTGSASTMAISRCSGCWPRKPVPARCWACSARNEEADLRAVFTQRHDLALGWQDFIAHRVDWNPKPDHCATSPPRSGSAWTAWCSSTTTRWNARRCVPHRRPR